MYLNLLAPWSLPAVLGGSSLCRYAECAVCSACGVHAGLLGGQIGQSQITCKAENFENGICFCLECVPYLIWKGGEVWPVWKWLCFGPWKSGRMFMSLLTWDALFPAYTGWRAALSAGLPQSVTIPQQTSIQTRRSAS